MRLPTEDQNNFESVLSATRRRIKSHVPTRLADDRLDNMQSQAKPRSAGVATSLEAALYLLEILSLNDRPIIDDGSDRAFGHGYRNDRPRRAV